MPCGTARPRRAAPARGGTGWLPASRVTAGLSGIDPAAPPERAYRPRRRGTAATELSDPRRYRSGGPPRPAAKPLAGPSDIQTS